MNTVEDRTRAAMDAITGLVDDVPPLILPPPPAVSRRSGRTPALRRRRGLWLAPAAAAFAMLTVAISLVIVRNMPDGPRVPAVTPAAAGAIPEYYVALRQLTVTSTASLVVGDTSTGTRVAAVSPPPGSTFAAVTGAADDRTFVVETQRGLLSDESEPGQPRTWYLLRLSPHSAHPARMTRLPIPATPQGTIVEALALSPDGSKLALAIQPDGLNHPGAPLYLRLYSMTTGSVLRSWSTTDTSAVFGGPKLGGADRNSVITWLSDGQTLTFVSHWTAGGPEPVAGSDVQPTAAQRYNTRSYLTIRTLDSARPGNDLIADSRLAWSTVTYPYRLSAVLACAPSAEGLLVAANGKAVVCGATAILRRPGTRGLACPVIKPWREVGFLANPTAAGRPPEILARYSSACTGAPLAEALWVSESGNAVIGYMAVGPAGGPPQGVPGARFGVFSRGKFTPLPYPLSSNASSDILLDSIAW